MTQPTERRFVMEPRLDAEVATLNADKISHGTVVNSDVAAGAAIDKTKIAGTAVTQADTGTVTSTMIANGTIVDADVNASAAIAKTKIAGTAITAADTGTVTSTMIADGTITEADLGALDYVKFDTTYAGGSTQPGMLNWNDTDGTLEFQLKGGNVTLQIGQEQVVRVKNNTGSTLSNGKAVYISGSDGSNLRVAYANAGAENTSAGTIGVLTEDLNNGNAGYVTTFGLVRAINTSALTEGAPVWLSTTDGVLTSTRPTAPNHSVMVGFCLRSHATVGVIFVRVDNGWELDELHNVLITSPTNGQALAYDSATGLWKNATPASTLNDLTDVTINSGTLSGGQVIKYDAGTTQWVNGAAAGGVTASATAPNLATSAAGDAWFDTNDGTLYVCYVDVDSTKQWVQVQANSALEASILSRVGALESQAIAYGTQSPNYLINGGMDIWQRATSQSTTGYGSADRWYNLIAGTATVSQETSDLPTGTRYGIKYVTGASSSYAQFHQVMETDNVIPLRGKLVTFSFYAKISGSYSGNIGVEVQYSNTTTDASYSGNNTAVTVTGTASAPTTWTRLSFTFTVPNDALSLRVGIIPTAAQPSGVTVRIANVQLEVGSTATGFRRNQNTYAAELSACMRYYQVSRVTLGPTPNGAARSLSLSFVPPMRATPTFTQNTAGSGTTFAQNGLNNYGWWGYTTIGTGTEVYMVGYTASAEL